MEKNTEKPKKPRKPMSEVLSTTIRATLAAYADTIQLTELPPNEDTSVAFMELGKAALVSIVINSNLNRGDVAMMLAVLAKDLGYAQANRDAILDQRTSDDAAKLLEEILNGK